MRENEGKHVKITLFLATALLLTALSHRFKIVGPRVVAVAFTMLLLSMYWIWIFPQALDSAVG
jgi:hypothetical protein